MIWENKDEVLIFHLKECSKTLFRNYHFKEVMQRSKSEIPNQYSKTVHGCFITAIPGCCPQCCDPSLKDSHEELEGIFSNYYKIYGWEEDAAVDEESHDHGDHIHPKLPCNHLQVGDGDDLSTDKAGDTKRRVPDGGQLSVFKVGMHESTLKEGLQHQFILESIWREWRGIRQCW